MQAAAHLAREERNLIRHHQLHLVEDAELLGLLDRQHRVAAPVDVDEHVGAGIGDVEQVRAEVRRAEWRHLVGHHRPAGILGQIVVHRLGDGVTVGVVRRHERGLLVLAELP